MIRNTILLAIAFGLTLSTFPSEARADLLWKLDATTVSADTPSNASLTRTLAPNVTGTDGDQYGASAVDLSNGRFDTELQFAGDIFIRHSVPPGHSGGGSGGHTTFTISGTNGALLYLDSLDFRVAVSTGPGRNKFGGFEIYGAVGGTPTGSDLLLDVNRESGTASSPGQYSIDLTAPAYQGIQSITFAFRPTANAGNVTIGIDELQLRGLSAIPEPSGMLILGGLAGTVLIRRRRRA